MKQISLLILLFLSISVSAQLKGIVKDSISKQPIPYVNISVENENIGTTSEENGEFLFPINDKNINLIFSALGYEKKKIKISKATEVFLKPMAYQLDEIVISKRYQTRQKEIGKVENQTFQAFDNGPRIDTKFFPYLPVYKKTKFIKQIVISTDSKIDDATFKIHFYNVDANGFPGEEMLSTDFIVSVSKGVKQTKFNVTKFNLRMPQDGLFVGFEKLMIEKNKLEKTITDPNTKIVQLQKTHYPFVLYAALQKDYNIIYSGGKWIKQTKQNPNDLTEKMMVYEPVMNLILTN